jgi:predicted outer membrane repeat protein
VTGDGSEGNPFATIQKGIDLATWCDTVLVASGTYQDCIHMDSDGNLNCVIMKSGVALMSESGQADCVTIDADSLGRAIYCSYVDATASITGFTLDGGFVGRPGGGGAYCYYSTPDFTNCEFSGNTAFQGGAVRCTYSSPKLTNCTAVHNQCDHQGAGLHLVLSSPEIDNTIIAYNSGGQGVRGYDSEPSLECSDVYGNEEGDWVGCIAGQAGTNGNISMDPLFCDPDNGDFTISQFSPCEPGHSGCGLIGAYGVGCEITETEEIDVALPAELCLGPAVPNPFNPTTQISYAIPAVAGPRRVVLKVYDCTGRLVDTLVDAHQTPGIYLASWNGRDHKGVAVASGVYFYRLTWNGKSETKRMVLLR